MNTTQAPPSPAANGFGASRFSHAGMVASLGGLILLCVLWESWLAPLRPGSYLASLKALPLLLPLVGAVRRNVYTIQWSSMLIWLYFTEGVVRGFRNPDALTSWLAWTEIALVLLFFMGAMFFLRPYKKHAKAQAKAQAKNDAKADANPAPESAHEPS